MAATLDAEGPAPGALIQPYLDLIRPGVLLLVTITGLPALVVGNAVWPSLTQAFFLLFGTALTGASCSALNAVLERDLDAKMTRTRMRPLPSGRLSVPQAVTFGVLTGLVATGTLYAAGGALAAALGVATIAFYVGIYTGWLKRRTPLNIVIGGAAGATAPLICDAGVDGVLGPAAWALFALIFLWTPPHFWAVALYREEEYSAAAIPMMPLVVGAHPTRWRMFLYGAALLPVALVPTFIGASSVGYGVFVTVIGLWFVVHLANLLRKRDTRAARKVFMVSNMYLLLVVGGMLVDGLLRLP